MLLRMMRLTERLSRLFVKLSLLMGRTVLASIKNIRDSIVDQFRSDRDPLSRAEAQVQRLSGVTVILLAAVVLLVLWATGAQASSSPVFNILDVGAPEQPAPLADQPLAPAAPVPQPAGVPLTNVGGTLLFAMDVGGQSDIFALEPGESEPVRLTADPADDRDPVWSPDGTRIAFSSRRDGNWELYTLNVIDGTVNRLTFDLVYEAAPSWSPDGEFLAYEAYYNGNLDVYIVRSDGSEAPYPLTVSPEPDFSPAWITTLPGREIAYVSGRGGDNDIYLINLSNPNELQARNLTDTPDINEDNPAWSPDGSRLAYEGAGEGLQLIYVNEIDAAPGSAQVVGQGFAPAWSADGQNLVFLADRGQNSVLLSGRIGAWESSVQALALGSFGYNIDWSSANLPEALQGTMATARSEPIGPAYEEGIAPDAGTTDPAFRLRVLEDVDVEGQFLTDAVDGSFNALRAAVERRAGWDFLGELDHAFWAIDRPVEAGESRQNWHKAGRAFAILDTYNQGDTPDIEVVPNQSGPDRYWDVYVRAAVQDGSLGRPLTERPWDFYARATDRDAYENGGRFKDEIPSGYYINFTQLARIYGWEPTPSDPSWYYNWNGILYWQYVKRDNLDWIQAMRQIYTADRLEEELGVIFVQPTQVGP